MVALGRGETVDCLNPKLDIFTTQASVLIDVAELEYQIFDVSTPAKQLAPVQVFPAIAGTRAVLDPTTDCPAGARLSTGRYAAVWDVPIDEEIGSHEIRWFFKRTAGSPEQSFSEEFEVLAVVGAGTTDDYCLVSDIRDEGIPASVADDALVARRITFASRFIDQVTGRFFNPRPLEFFADGEGHGQLFLQEPIIALEELEITVEGINFTDQPVDLNDVAIYNRAISQNLTRPDDRANPRIAFKRADREFARLHALIGQRVFYEGKQNVRVKGIFGYTDYDGTALGKTPDLICHACKLLVIKKIAPLGDTDAQADAAGAGAIRRLKTRDQEIEYQNRKAVGGLTEGPFTGDFEIDNILMMFARPMDIAVI